MGRLGGRAALITGAGAGIGRGVALKRADEGARIMFRTFGRLKASTTSNCCALAESMRPSSVPMWASRPKFKTRWVTRSETSDA